MYVYFKAYFLFQLQPKIFTKPVSQFQVQTYLGHLNEIYVDTWLDKPVERAALDFQVVFKPCTGCRVYLKNEIKKKYICLLFQL